MKHFRQIEQPEIVETLQKVTGVALEDTRLSMLYDLLVTQGDHLQAERFINNALSSKSVLLLSFHKSCLFHRMSRLYIVKCSF
jgi:hypothetical protein